MGRPCIVTGEPVVAHPEARCNSRAHVFGLVYDSAALSAELLGPESSAYALLRHPSYTAGILMNAGVGLALGSWASAALLAVSSVAVYCYRMAVEERALLSAV